MPEDLMRYDQLAQTALLGVVREALRIVERQGLPGEHHFYIAFDTRHPGVELSPRIAERYPREMTIVLQHQFLGLAVFDDRFEVELYFDNIPEKLIVPFEALKGFLDPSVQFGLQFETAAPPPAAVDKPKVRPRPQRPQAVEKPPAQEIEPADGALPEDAPKIVSLDSFRKK
jgi:hypothetical protein